MIETWSKSQSLKSLKDVTWPVSLQHLLFGYYFNQWLKRYPKDIFWRLTGHVTFSRLWSKFAPKATLWRPAGHATWSRLWLKRSPKVKLWRPAGHVTLSRPWSNRDPKNKFWRPAGHATLSRLWLKRAPKVKSWRPAGNLMWWISWLNVWPKVKVRRLLGKLRRKAGISSSTPVTCVIPFNENFFILNAVRLGRMQGRKQIDGHVGSGHLFPLTPKSFMLQTFVQHEL